MCTLSTKKTSDRATAEEMRKQAMERMGDTAKRRNDAKGDGNLKEIKKVELEVKLSHT